MQDFLWAACEQASIIAFIEATTFFFLFVAPGKLRQTAGILFDGMIWTDQSSRSTSQASELDMALKEGGDTIRALQIAIKIGRMVLVQYYGFDLGNE